MWSQQVTLPVTLLSPSMPCTHLLSVFSWEQGLPLAVCLPHNWHNVAQITLCAAARTVNFYKDLVYSVFKCHKECGVP